MRARPQPPELAASRSLVAWPRALRPCTEDRDSMRIEAETCLVGMGQDSGPDRHNRPVTYRWNPRAHRRWYSLCRDRMNCFDPPSMAVQCFLLPLERAEPMHPELSEEWEAPGADSAGE